MEKAMRVLSTTHSSTTAAGSMSSALQEHVAAISILQTLYADLYGHYMMMIAKAASIHAEQLMHDTMLEWFPEQHYLSIVYWHYAMWLVLLLLHAGALYFLLAKAAIRGYSWQIAFFRATVSEILIDVLFIEVLHIAVLEYLLPGLLVAPEMEKMQTLVLMMLLTGRTASASLAAGVGTRDNGRVDVSADAKHFTSSMELSHLLRCYGSLPESSVLQVILAQPRHPVVSGEPVVDVMLRRILNAEVETGTMRQRRPMASWKQKLMWIMYWLPRRLVQSAVEMCAAFVATFLLYIFFFVLVAQLSMSNTEAAVVLCAPLIVWTVYVLWDRYRYHHSLEMVSTLTAHGGWGSYVVPAEVLSRVEEDESVVLQEGKVGSGRGRDEENDAKSAIVDGSSNINIHVLSEGEEEFASVDFVSLSSYELDNAMSTSSSSSASATASPDSSYSSASLSDEVTPIKASGLKDDNSCSDDSIIWSNMSSTDESDNI